MNIVYDHQIFTVQKYGGVSRYICEVASRISTFNGQNVKIIAGLNINSYLNQYNKKIVKGYSIPILQTATISSFLFDSINSKYLISWLKKNSVDVLHHTHYYNFNRRITDKNYKTVLTVHDMIYEKFQDTAPNIYPYLAKEKLESVERADHIICVSENTKKDLIEILKVDEKKVSTIYHGCSFQENKLIIQKPIFKNPYILYVGSRRQKYKNFRGLLEAYASRPNIKNNFYLICFDREKISSDELNLINKLGIEREKILQISGNDALLSNLYRNASLFVYPSLYEGFGFPPLEAMSCSCPVACSNVSSIPEVVGNAGEYFNPYEVDSIAEALEKVLFCKTRTNELINLGKERLHYFSWQKCAEETLSTYKNLL
jgi:glycosyltransferase involved in cell wall biosynthesis